MGRPGQAWQAARGPKVPLCAPLSSIPSPWGAWGWARVIGDGVPWHFTHGGGIFLRIPVIPSTSRSPVSPMAALRASPQMSGCWKRGLGFTLVISAWQCLFQCFPSALQSQYKHSSAFLQLSPWKQSSRTSNIFPFLLISSPLRLMPPSLSVSHRSFGKTQCSLGIWGKVYQESRWRLSLY